MRELSLFTGAGGGLLGTMLLGWTPIGYVEYDDYCQRVIAARIADGILPAAPIFGDIRAFIGEGYAASYTGMVDVLSAGFPCQPFSLAGKQLGADDPRNMWPATVECLRLVRPQYALLENVPGLLTSGYFGRILGDLAESGYDCRWRILSAAELGAPHKRDRLWIVAHAQEQREPHQPSVSNRREGQRHETKRLSAGASGGSDGGDTAAGTIVNRRTAAEISGDVAHAAQQPERKPADEANAVANGRHAWPQLGGGSWWEAEP